MQHELELKWYIDLVEPNYIYTIPEEPPPWPPFVIGDLNVAFKSIPHAHVPYDYSTIQEAINAANPEDAILIASGTYAENVIVNKTVSLMGEDKETTIINGMTRGPVIKVTADNVSISGFTLQNSSSILYLEGGDVFVLYSDYVKVVGNVIRDTQYGINLHGSNHNLIVDNFLVNNDIGLQMLFNSTKNAVYHNNFVNNKRQIDVSESYNNTWDNGCEGSYWSDYNGTDLDRDGIGDTELPWQGVDYHPLMNPYWLRVDINHDLKIDIKDVAIAAKAYGSYPGDPNWNPHADITGPPDNNINIRDIALIALKYGKTWTS